MGKRFVTCDSPGEQRWRRPRFPRHSHLHSYTRPTRAHRALNPYKDHSAMTQTMTQPTSTAGASDAVRKHKEYLFPAVTMYYKEPIALERGQGEYVWDDQ